VPTSAKKHKTKNGTHKKTNTQKREHTKTDEKMGTEKMVRKRWELTLVVVVVWWKMGVFQKGRPKRLW
jgi:hypothetical protein